MTAPSRLRAVLRLVGKSGFDHRFDVAGQSPRRGHQGRFRPGHHPTVWFWPRATGIRVGRLPVYVAKGSFRILRGRLVTGRSVGRQCIWRRLASLIWSMAGGRGVDAV
jgi:hypothetical protein